MNENKKVGYKKGASLPVCIQEAIRTHPPNPITKAQSLIVDPVD